MRRRCLKLEHFPYGRMSTYLGYLKRFTPRNTLPMHSSKLSLKFTNIHRISEPLEERAEGESSAVVQMPVVRKPELRQGQELVEQDRE